MSALGRCCLGLVLLALVAQAQAQARLVLRLDTLQLPAQDGGFLDPPPLQATPEDGWLSVPLPDVNAPRDSTRADMDRVITTFYRLPVDEAMRASGQPLVLYLPRWQTVGQLAVYGDGHLLWRSTGDRVWNGFNRPVWVELCGLDGSPCPRQVLIRMDSAQGLGGGISRLWLGPEEELALRYGLRFAVEVLVPVLIGVALLAFGGFALGVWLRRRQETIYGLFFLAALLYLLRLLNYLGLPDEHAFSSAWFGWIATNSMGWLILVGVQFNLRLCGCTLPRLERSLLGVVLASSALTLPLLQSSGHIAALSMFCYLALLALFLLALPRMMGVARRTGRLLPQLLAWANLAALPLGVHDLLLQNYWTDLGHFYLVPYWLAGFCLLFGYVLLRRHLDSLEGLERSHEVLAQALAEREAELEESYRQLRDVEQRETLARERQRLMQDMHDGLGTSLTGALRMAERAMTPPEELQAVLRECLDELRDTLDSLEPTEADVALLLGTLRPRLQRRLAASGIVLQWEVDALLALPWMASADAMHVMRIVQEVIGNSLKHAGASCIHLACQSHGDGVWLRIDDDGRGFAPDDAPRSEGRGLGNICRRARLLGGSVAWAAGEGGRGTRFSLWLPAVRDPDVEHARSESPAKHA